MKGKRPKRSSEVHEKYRNDPMSSFEKIVYKDRQKQWRRRGEAKTCKAPGIRGKNRCVEPTARGHDSLKTAFGKEENRGRRNLDGSLRPLQQNVLPV